MAEVVVLDAEAKAHLWRIMGGEISADQAPHGHDAPCDICKRIRAALDSLPVEEIEERRGVEPDGSVVVGASPLAVFDSAFGAHTHLFGTDGFRIQSRTITTFSDGSELIGPWTDLPSEEGER